MKKHVFFLLVVMLFFSSCITYERCRTRWPCPQMVEQQKKDSIVYQVMIFYRDTTIYDTIIGDTVYNVIDTVYLDPWGNLYTDTSVLFNDYAMSIAYLYNNRLYHDLIQKDTVLKRKLDNAIKEVTRYKEKYIWQIERYELEKKKNTKLQNIADTLGYIVFCIGLLAIFFVIWKIYRKFR